MNKEKWVKIFYERLTEPLHLNIISAVVAVIGSYKTKVAFDLIVRPQYAYSILHAAEVAKQFNIKKITICEFGVASGAGLLNMCDIARRTTAVTGIEFDIIGFDGGKGLPEAVDYRDFPESFQAGDYPMDYEALIKKLPNNCRLILGDINETALQFAETLSSDSPLGFAAIDVDYYSSAKGCLNILKGKAEGYLPWLPIHLDDIMLQTSSKYTGELLAVEEFNTENSMRKVVPANFLHGRRIFKNANWINFIFTAQIHDHASRHRDSKRDYQRVAENPYLKG